ncbi:hypothetical protein MRX96_046671 [Rhipicephalus microplus]
MRSGNIKKTRFLKSRIKRRREVSTLDESDPTEASSGSSGVCYARAVRWLWHCSCTGSCCVAVPLLVGLVAHYAIGGRGVDVTPYFRGGRLSGSMLVDVSQQPTLLASLNRSVNPCHNFYRFVCDGWVARQGDRLSLLEEVIKWFAFSYPDHVTVH